MYSVTCLLSLPIAVHVTRPSPVATAYERPMSRRSTTLSRLTALKGASSAVVVLLGADASQSATDRLRREELESGFASGRTFCLKEPDFNVLIRYSLFEYNFIETTVWLLLGGPQLCQNSSHEPLAGNNSFSKLKLRNERINELIEKF